MPVHSGQNVTNEVRVRIAPSPTGTLHVGTARTALYNYLYAKRHHGKFIFRLEDTDEVRSKDEHTVDLIEGLHWLGLTWDEGPDIGGPFAPYKQTEKVAHYSDIANSLVASGKAYLAYETVEELAAIKGDTADGNSRYDNRGRNYTAEQLEKFRAENRQPSIRFRIDEPRTVTWNDAIKGQISIDTSTLGGDMVIVKSNGVAIYNFAVVVDDVDMEMTQVIRGDDHVNNTAKQILLYEALGHTVPQFGHVPLMTDIEHHKLSKRKHGESVHVGSYQKSGYMPEAIVNYLAQMSWTPGDDREIFSLAEASEIFDLGKVSKSQAVFDTQKLDWFNGHYIRSLPLSVITERSKAFIDESKLHEYSDAQLEELVGSVRENLTKLSEVSEHVDFYFGDTLTIPEDIQSSVLNSDSAKQVLNKALQSVGTMPWGDNKGCKAVVDAIGKELKIKGKDLYWPLRAALSGKTHGPDLGLMLSVLGEKRVKARLESALGLCRSC
jgi:nondiscriminating glutamyl-tRNA synthetase